MNVDIYLLCIDVDIGFGATADSGVRSASNHYR